MNFSIRELKQDEVDVLDTFLYEAIFIPEGVSAPPKDIINQPELQVYVKDFGDNKGDLCMIAQVEDEIVGAAWVRVIQEIPYMIMPLVKPASNPIMNMQNEIIWIEKVQGLVGMLSMFLLMLIVRDDIKFFSIVTSKEKVFFSCNCSGLSSPE